jgi:hypothetical protein
MPGPSSPLRRRRCPPLLDPRRRKLPALLAAVLALGVSGPLSAQEEEVILPAFAAPMMDPAALPESFPAGSLVALLLEHLKVAVAPGRALPMVMTVEVFSGEGTSLGKIRGSALDLESKVGGPMVPAADDYFYLPVAEILPGGPDAASVSELFHGLPLFPSDTPLKAKIDRTSVEPSAGAVDLEDLSWPFEAGEEVKVLVLHVLPDFSLPPEVRTPDVGGGWSYEAIGLVIFLWPAES